ncbi:DUF6630 family protein [Pseudomonas mucidolens]|uniref:DUF6630 family protein n=1 Tax=Pseudomonas mucidolens TaxID=46679 RepID=UPI0030D740B4
MGFLERLFGGRFTLPPPDETNLSSSAILKELRPGAQNPGQRHALKTFAETLLARAPEQEGARLVQRILRKYAMGDSTCTALTEGLLDDARGQKLEYLALLSVDWRGYDEFEYSAPYLVEAAGLPQTYVYRHTGTSSMPQVLEHFDQWLAGLGKRFVHLDSEDDRYTGFIVAVDQVAAMIELARASDIRVSLDSF